MFAFIKKNLSKIGVGSDPSSSIISVSRFSWIAIAGVVGMLFLAREISSDTWDACYRMVWLLTCCIPLIMFYRAIAQKGFFTARRMVMLVVMLMVQMLLMLAVNLLRPMVHSVLPSVSGYSMLLLVLPYVLAPAVAAILVNPRFGTFAALSATMLGLPLFPDGTSNTTLVEYVSVSFLTGVVGAAFAGHAKKREQILYSGAGMGLVVFAAVVLLGLLHSEGGDGAAGVDFVSIGLGLGIAVGVNFLLMVVVSGLMPMLEKIFNISTHITWLEWADMNHALLKRLQMTAPGTFHHSLCVQRLAEAAAEAVGADVTRAGVCALYHDIGKVEAPLYFAENIQDQANSPHRSLTPEGSARIITGHVQRGVELAREHKLNSRIIDVIREHHGVSTPYFFYRKAMDRYEEDLRKFEEGLTDTSPEEVDKSVFSYKGPVPQTRESGIVSMADAVESATRSLQHPTEEDIRNMVESIFKGRILDGHLQDSGLTLGDIALMKQSFIQTLRIMNHNRIAYPKPKEDDAVAKLAQERKESASKD